AWLLSQGVDERAAQEALDAARGHPGLAAQWLREDGLAVRRTVAQDLEQISAGRASAVEVAQRWTNDGQADQRLRHAADLALAQASAGLTDPSRLHKLATWFDAANRTRDLLRTTVRADLAVTELLLAWREGERPARSRGTR
ncbi:MAG: DNA polymerase III subunit delta', partial [Oxalobacteraceae bacterium]